MFSLERVFTWELHLQQAPRFPSAVGWGAMRSPGLRQPLPSTGRGLGLGLGLGRRVPDFRILSGTNLLQVTGKEVLGRYGEDDAAEVSGAWGPSQCGPSGSGCPAGAQPDRGRPCDQALTLRGRQVSWAIHINRQMKTKTHGPSPQPTSPEARETNPTPKRWPRTGRGEALAATPTQCPPADPSHPIPRSPRALSTGPRQGTAVVQMALLCQCPAGGSTTLGGNTLLSN